MNNFEPFEKIPRFNRDVVITEKIDGTNAQIFIPEEAEQHLFARKVIAGSRNRYIEPGDDNYGFASWVERNYEELLKLGPGRHFGEWWGKGIQRGYGLEEKRFSLFNVNRWLEPYKAMLAGHENAFPKCCHVVPLLYKGPLWLEHDDNSTLGGYQPLDGGLATNAAIAKLAGRGSQAAPGFMNPEGIVVYHTAAQQLFKVTLENDEKPKGSRE